jgi:hypothetical protein
MRKFTILLGILLLAVTMPVLAQESLNPGTAPNFGIATLNPGWLPDPYIVTLTSGGSVDVAALNLGESCRGFATSAPDYRIQWGGTGSSLLRIFFVGSEGDTTLVVNQPNGQWLCGDDSYDTLNPSIDIANAPAGQYDIWVGSFELGTSVSGYLMITEADSYPGHLISPILGQIVNPMEGNSASAVEGTLDVSAAPNFGTIALATGFTPDPFTTNIVSGGSIDISTLNLGAECRGFVTASPDFQLELSGTSARLRIFVVGEGDTTLVVNGADGQWWCNDDSSGTVNPMVEFTNAPAGFYDVWVGSFNTGTAVGGTLYITEQDINPSTAPSA